MRKQSVIRRRMNDRWFVMIISITMLLCTMVVLWGIAIVSDYAALHPLLFYFIFLGIPSIAMIAVSVRKIKKICLWTIGYALAVALFGVILYTAGLTAALIALGFCCLLPLLWKKNRRQRAVLWLLLMLLPCQAVLARQYSVEKYTEVKTCYLDGTTDFDRAAMVVMPSPDALDGQEIVTFRAHLLPRGEWVVLKAQYDTADYSDAVAELSYPFFDDIVEGTAYFMTPASFEYRGFELRFVDVREYNEMDLSSYAMAVGTNAQTQEILYVFFDSWYFEFMGADDAFRLIFDEVLSNFPSLHYKSVRASEHHSPSPLVLSP